MNSKVSQILESAIIITLGILIAIFRIDALDTYFGILAVVIGTLLLILVGVTLAKTKALDLTGTFLAPILLTIGIALLAGGLSLGALVILLVYLLMGFGIGLVLLGTYTATRKGGALLGIGEIVVGALIVLFTILFLTVEDFRGAFWIIVGILIAIYGALSLVYALTRKDTKKK